MPSSLEPRGGLSCMHADLESASRTYRVIWVLGNIRSAAIISPMLLCFLALGFTPPRFLPQRHLLIDPVCATMQRFQTRRVLPEAPSLPFARCGNTFECRRPVCQATMTTSTPKTVVVTDMDETLISSKSTGFVIKFLIHYKAYLRLAVALPCALFLIPLSKVSRTLAVRIMYWLAFRGIRVSKAHQIAEDLLPPSYAADLQDPAATAVLSADAAVVITASPTFMARPWLKQYLGVPNSNVYGAELIEANGRFTGMTADLPIGTKKVEILKSSCASLPGVTSIGYGDHPTDVPFLEACDSGILVEKFEACPPGITYIAPSPLKMAIPRSN